RSGRLEATRLHASLGRGGSDARRVVSTAGRCAGLEGAEMGRDDSTTGRVIQTGQPVLTPNILREPDADPAVSPSGAARAAMIAPLKTSSGAVGAVGVLRYAQPGAEEVSPFGLVDLQYLTAVAAYIAGGLE